MGEQLKHHHLYFLNHLFWLFSADHVEGLSKPCSCHNPIVGVRKSNQPRSGPSLTHCPLFSPPFSASLQPPSLCVFRGLSCNPQTHSDFITVIWSGVGLALLNTGSRGTGQLQDRDRDRRKCLGWRSSEV